MGARMSDHEPGIDQIRRDSGEMADTINAWLRGGHYGKEHMGFSFLLSVAGALKYLSEYNNELYQAGIANSDNWQLVPKEATPEMVQAAEDRQVESAQCVYEGTIQFDLWRDVWKAMLAAAPNTHRTNSTIIR